MSAFYNYNRSVRIAKMPSAQLDILLKPALVKKTNRSVEKLIQLGLLEKGNDYVPFRLTPKGVEFVDAYKKGRPRMTAENMHDIAQVFKRLGVEADIKYYPSEMSYPVITLRISDPAHGNMIVERLDYAPSNPEAGRIVKRMRLEQKERAKNTRSRKRYF